MRVFVTGASGFIGAHLLRLVLAADHEVAILAVADDPLWRLKSMLDRVRVLRGDLDAVEKFAPALADFQPEACIHLAWYVEPGRYLESPLNINCVTNSLNLLQLLIQIRCQQVIMTGTCAEYDTDIGYLKETSPTKPMTLYAASKLTLGILGQQLVKDTNTRFAWARLFYLYGPQEDERRVVPALIKSLLRSEPFPVSAGTQIRDYLHVEDVASALWSLASQGLDGTFNISSGVPITMRALMEIIGNAMGKTDLIQFGTVQKRDWEPEFICGDNQKLRQLGWQPRYGLQDGLVETIKWWQNA